MAGGVHLGIKVRPGRLEIGGVVLTDSDAALAGGCDVLWAGAAAGKDLATGVISVRLLVDGPDATGLTGTAG